MAACCRLENALLDEATAFVRRRTTFTPRVALFLGSGFGPMADAVDAEASFAAGSVPHLAAGAVAGHEGRILLGRIADVPCFVLRGRPHLYEGHDPRVVARPVRLARRLGCSVLAVTNAAGGIREDLRPGDLMLLADHLNLTGGNPLVGPHEEALGPRFPDLRDAYDPDLRRIAREEARAAGCELAEGVYAALLGPSYETPAEIRMLRAMGADAVGMSTVHEVIAAVQGGMRVLGISGITNRAAGLGKGRLSHDDVLAVGARIQPRIHAVLERILRRIGGDRGSGGDGGRGAPKPRPGPTSPPRP